MRIIERVAEHCDVQEAEFGRVYIWCPEGIVLQGIARREGEVARLINLLTHYTRTLAS